MSLNPHVNISKILHLYIYIHGIHIYTYIYVLVSTENAERHYVRLFEQTYAYVCICKYLI